MNDRSLEKALRAKIQGEVRFDRSDRALYATDGSNYRFVPMGLVTPKSAEDIQNTLRICRAFNAPVLSRGGGTGLAGQTTNAAVILDHSKYYNRILKLDPQACTARVQPGIVLDELRSAARRHGLTFGPDPATHTRCTLGGMIGNNSCGPHAVMAGKTVENVITLDVVTYDGLRLEVGPTSENKLQLLAQMPGREGEIYRGLRALRDRYANLIRARYPKIPRRVSGYNLDQLLPENGFNVARALVGSEGTCATVLEATLRLVPNPKIRALVVIGFYSLYEAGLSVPRLMELGPIALEGIDELLVQDIRLKHLDVENLAVVPDGHAWMIFEIGAGSEEERDAKVALATSVARTLEGFRDVRTLIDEHQQKQMWDVRESSLGATAYVPGQEDNWEGWEDSAVPPDQVGPYMRDLKNLFRKFDYRASIYGHFGQGCVHCRINFDFKTAEGIRKYRAFTDQAADLVVGYGGSLSGEHGDGQSRADLLPKMFGPELIGAFEEFKKLWDPDGKMNPGKVVWPHARVDNLKLGTQYAPATPPTHFDFPDDHGDFSRAALRCVGVGACRRHSEGVMCPSYMATREEKHSTRGRAHLLFEMLRGELIEDGWRSREVKEALDLCLACKGCKHDCPVNVDMATYKAEFLSHHYKGRLRPRSAYAMGQLPWTAPWGAAAPKLANWLTHAPGLSEMAKRLAGLHAEREFPNFAPRSFRDLHRELPARGGDVILWVDTFNNYFRPDIAESALRALQATGFTVQVPRKHYCCGRPFYDFGFLTQAKRYLARILHDFREEIRQGVQFVFLEPSCASVFRDELPNLFSKDQDANRLSRQSFMLSEYLMRLDGYPWPKRYGRAVVHGHCHHKSIMKFDDEVKALRQTGLMVDVLDSGCCGMAGAFGFEKEHFEISKAVGERVLLPKVRAEAPETLIVTDGFSCREQIEQLAGRKSTHLAQILDPEFRMDSPL